MLSLGYRLAGQRGAPATVSVEVTAAREGL